MQAELKEIKTLCAADNAAGVVERLDKLREELESSPPEWQEYSKAARQGEVHRSLFAGLEKRTGEIQFRQIGAGCLTGGEADGLDRCRTVQRAAESVDVFAGR